MALACPGIPPAEAFSNVGWNEFGSLVARMKSGNNSVSQPGFHCVSSRLPCLSLRITHRQTWGAFPIVVQKGDVLC